MVSLGAGAAADPASEADQEVAPTGSNVVAACDSFTTWEDVGAGASAVGGPAELAGSEVS